MKFTTHVVNERATKIQRTLFLIKFLHVHKYVQLVRTAFAKRANRFSGAVLIIRRG